MDIERLSGIKVNRRDVFDDGSNDNHREDLRNEVFRKVVDFINEEGSSLSDLDCRKHAILLQLCSQNLINVLYSEATAVGIDPGVPILVSKPIEFSQGLIRVLDNISYRREGESNENKTSLLLDLPETGLPDFISFSQIPETSYPLYFLTAILQNAARYGKQTIWQFRGKVRVKVDMDSDYLILSNIVSARNYKECSPVNTAMFETIKYYYGQMSKRWGTKPFEYSFGPSEDGIDIYEFTSKLPRQQSR